MPLVFSIEEVREYLSEMGYGDLTDDDLDKFVHDLRKLIKRDSRQRRRIRLGHTGRTHSDLSSSAEANSSARDSSAVEDTSQSIVEQEPDGPARLLRTPKSKLKKQKPRRVEISSDFSGTHDSTSGTTGASGTGTTNESNNTGVSETSSSSISSSTPLSTSDALRERNGNRDVEVGGGGGGRRETKGARPVVVKTRPTPQRREQQQQQQPKSEEVDENSQLLGGLESSSSSSATELSDTDLLYLMEHILKADLTEAGSQAETGKKKFQVPMKIRRDPVALYHWYKTFWERQKAPGEDRHMQLRWNVRAGTIGRFPCDDEGNPIQYLPLNPIKPRKKIPAF